MSAHTPGPWWIDGAEVVAADGLIVRQAAAYDAAPADLSLIVPTNTERMQAFRQCQPVQFANAIFTDIEGREYERQEMLDGRDMQARGFDDNADRFTFGG
jgi:hypothetical protein